MQVDVVGEAAALVAGVVLQFRVALQLRVALVVAAEGLLTRN